MPWYTYLFIALAVLAGVYGTGLAVQSRNTLRFVRCLLLAVVYAALAYWTGWA